MKLNNILFWGLLIAAIACSKKSGNDRSDTGETTPATETPVKTDVAIWLTNPDKTQLLAKQNISLLRPKPIFYPIAETDGLSPCILSIW